MKHLLKYMLPLVLQLLSFIIPGKASAQSQELQQLILDVKKLTQFKNILNDMKTGYQIYSKGYGLVSNLSKGNFNLHDLYLGSLMAINPSIRNYGRVGEIISMQVRLVGEYKAAISGFRSSDVFNVTELAYMENVYSRLLAESLDDLTELTHLITANELRMSDAERIESIDRLYATGADKLQFLRSFNRQGALLAIQRSKDLADIRTMKQVFTIKN
ncbi:TerB family tellurite resistance protein [Mucilaginibacter sp. cycad4]|uniref:TerB family tellurite resistance protein n=1 Tax=Mucilaginibacter sp. cycad4 TaxID=3342096 RepID=UPI002AAB0D45|nr:TerB family tellurite resistance protein [Mucilaginibacter gossypii]WPU98402.1 TerB family tellurite resistance protein [Mucilaginibacter gossypii]